MKITNAPVFLGIKQPGIQDDKIPFSDIELVRQQTAEKLQRLRKE